MNWLASASFFSSTRKCFALCPVLGPVNLLAEHRVVLLDVGDIAIISPGKAGKINLLHKLRNFVVCQ